MRDQYRELSDRKLKEFFRKHPVLGTYGVRRCYRVVQKGSIVLKTDETDPGQWEPKEACDDNAIGYQLATPAVILAFLKERFPFLNINQHDMVDFWVGYGIYAGSSIGGIIFFFFAGMFLAFWATEGDGSFWGLLILGLILYNVID